MSALRISYRGAAPVLVDLGPAWAAASNPIGRLSAAWGNLPDDESHAVGAGPIEIRKATPEDLARLEVAEPTPIRKPKRAPDDLKAAGLRGAAATRRRFSCPSVDDWTVVATLRGTGGNVSWAANLLGVSIAAMHRRVADMRENRRLPSDLVVGREAQYSARRPRGSVAA